MKRFKKLLRFLGWVFYIALNFIILESYCQIRIVFTVALTDAHFDFRKLQYIESFEILKKMGYENVYVIEALKKRGPTFLEDYSRNVYYSSANNPQYRNQGTNEARTSLDGTYYFGFEPDDMILKLTGRHHFIADYFLKLVENNPEFDAFVKVDNNGNVYTVCFAMKCKYYQEMYEHMDYDLMERNWINLEYMVGNYIKHKEREGSFKVFYADKLGVEADNFGSSTALGAPHNIIIF